jgi:predicted outer membrane repeat protein
MNRTLVALARAGMAAFLLAAGFAAPTYPVYASTGALLIVNSNSDAENASDGFCTLREAMIAALANVDFNECVNSGNPYGDDLIQFSLVSPTITLGSTLPILNGGTLTIEGSNAGNPVVIDGAGAYRVFNITGGITTLGNLTVQNGSGSDNGGGGGALIISSTLIVLRSAFLNNTSPGGDGGAINCNGGCSLTISNSTFAGNTASVGGGALMNNSGTVSIYNSTFSGNSGETGGAIGTWNGGAGNPTTTIYNSILANSTASEDCYNYSLGTLTGSNNIIETTAGSPSDCSAVTQYTSDPNLGALTGSPAYFPLNSGGPAIDAGNDTVCAGPPVNGMDQRGAARPLGPHCDIGAFEREHLFADVPVTGKEWMEPWIEAFYYAGITTGCNPSPLSYCPENQVTRAEMAVFLLRAKHGAGYVPPAPTHDFADVPVTGKEWMEPWIEQFYAEGITTGCGGGNYCPENNVTRAEMAVFVLRALNGGGYTPPAATHTFADVPVTGKEWMEPWIDQFAAQGITTGCGGGNYCPENNVTRAEMAVFIDRAYGLYP